MARFRLENLREDGVPRPSAAESWRPPTPYYREKVSSPMAEEGDPIDHIEPLSLPPRVQPASATALQALPASRMAVLLVPVGMVMGAARGLAAGARSGYQVGASCAQLLVVDQTFPQAHALSPTQKVLRGAMTLMSYGVVGPFAAALGSLFGVATGLHGGLVASRERRLPGLDDVAPRFG